MKIVSSFFVLFLIEQVVSKSDRVKLKDVQVLTLQKGKYTEARRSRPMHQLMCVGGTARCSFIPETVQCYNRGWDGRTVNWECKADLNKKYSFGLLEVNCEGYEHPDDDYILAGSCGLEFTINVADGVPRQRNFNPPPYLKTMTPDYSGLAQSILIIILVFGALSLIHLSYVYNTTTSPDYFGNPPIKLTRKKPPTPGSFHSSNERKVKLDKKSMSLVGSLITAPPSDKSKLTIPKPIIDCSDRRHIQPNRPASSMATNRLKSAAGNDEIPSSSKKREFLYTGKVRSTPPYDHGSGPSCEPETLEGDGPDFVTFVAGGLLGYLCARNSARLSYTRESFSSSTHQNNSNFGKTYASTETETETKSGYATTKRR